MTPSTALAMPDSPGAPTHTIDSTRGGDPPTVLRCGGTADFLAALPFLAGFTAENSLFIVLFTGRRARSVMRLDLPRDPGAMTLELLDTVCELVAESGLGAERPAAVITSEQTFAEAGGAPWRHLAKLLRRRFDREGWPLRDLAVVAPDGWAALLDSKAPERGRPLSEIGASPVNAQALEQVGEPRPLDELGGLPEADPERAAAVVGRLAELDHRESARRPAMGEPVGPPAWLHGVARVAGACFDQVADTPEPRLCARLIRATEYSGGWLAVLLAAMTRPEFVIDVAEEMGPLRFVDPPLDSESGWSVRGLLFAFAQAPPEPVRLRRAIAVLEDATTHAPPARRSGLLAMLAWAWWMLGLQSVALPLVRQSLAAEPEHEIALMVERLIASPPGWSSRPGPPSE